MLNSYWEYAGTRYKHKFQAIQSADKNYRDIKFRMFSDKNFSDI